MNEKPAALDLYLVEVHAEDQVVPARIELGLHHGGVSLGLRQVLQRREYRARWGSDKEQRPRLPNQLRHSALYLWTGQVPGSASGRVGSREIEAESRLQFHPICVVLSCRLRHSGLRVHLGHVGADLVVHLHGALHRQLHADVVRLLQHLVQLVVRDVVDNAVVDYSAFGETPYSASVHVFDRWSASRRRHKSLGPRERSREHSRSNVLPLSLLRRNLVLVDDGPRVLLDVLAVDRLVDHVHDVGIADDLLGQLHEGDVLRGALVPLQGVSALVGMRAISFGLVLCRSLRACR